MHSIRTVRFCPHLFAHKHILLKLHAKKMYVIAYELKLHVYAENVNVQTLRNFNYDKKIEFFYTHAKT